HRRRPACPAPSHHVGGEGRGHGTQTTGAQLHWRIGATDLPGGPLQIHWRIGAVHPGTGRCQDEQASSGKDVAAVRALQNRSERRAKLAGIGAKLGARPRPWTASCEPTETRSETDISARTLVERDRYRDFLVRAFRHTAATRWHEKQSGRPELVC